MLIPRWQLSCVRHITRSAEMIAFVLPTSTMSAHAATPIVYCAPWAKMINPLVASCNNKQTYSLLFDNNLGILVPGTMLQVLNELVYHDFAHVANP